MIRWGELSGALPLKTDLVSTFRVDPARDPTATLHQLQAGLFTPGCALSGYHSPPRPAAGLDLSAGVAFESIHQPLSGHRLVQPEDPDASRLIATIRRPWDDPHVNGYLQVGNAKVQMLREWIAAGAQND